MAKNNHARGESSTNGTDLQTLFMEAVQLHQNNHLNRAEEKYLLILKSMPGNSRVLGNLGILYKDLQRYEEAENCYTVALKHDPQDPLLHLNLGAVYEAGSDLAAAASCFRRALELQPANPKALNNLGKILCLQGLPDEAERYINHALQLEPCYPIALNNLGVVYSKQGKNREAINCLERSLALQPSDVNTLYNLAGAYGSEEKNELAARCLGRLLELDPNHTAAQHMIAALSGTTTETAPQRYIEDTFDLYAAGFDSHLVDKLQYTAPAALRLLLQESADEKRRFSRAADLGCGTGLSGREFRDITDDLTGIDLSANMLAQADAKKLYDRLVRKDITAFLQESGEQFDLFIATDVFIYVGKLEKLFAGVSHCAAPKACFVFSIERATAHGKDYELCSSGRYAHSPGYIGRLADQHGFGIEKCQEHGIRKEKGKWIPGNLFVLKKQSLMPPL